MLRAALRPLRWLRFVFVWPAVTAYRRRANRSLRWRLAGYNLLTLVAGLATALILVGLLAAVGANARNYAAQEPAEDARAVADFLFRAGVIPREPAFDIAEQERLLHQMVTHRLLVYPEPAREQFDTRPDRYLIGASALILRGRASQSWQATAGESENAAAVAQVFERAYSGETDLRRLSIVDGDRGVGAYPLISEGVVYNVVVVEKHDIQAPQGWAILRAQIRPVVTTVWVGSVVAALPGLAVASVLAVAAARSVGGRIRNVSNAAESLATGELSSRAPVSGEDEVATLALSFNAMAERLQDTMSNLEAERERALALLDANRQLVANVSHELRTPVAIIRGQVEALDESDPENARLAAALREITRLEQLVTDLFQLASAEAGNIQVVLADTDIAAVVRDAAQPLRDLAWRDSKVRVGIQANDPVLAIADGERLSRVVQNLIRNAIRHTADGGMAWVAVYDEPAPHLTVSDTGPGIPPEDLPHVFERFFRGDTSRARDTGGAGLGLAIARELVAAMGGTLEAASPPGEGATFTIRLQPAAVTGEPPAGHARTAG